MCVVHIVKDLDGNVGKSRLKMHQLVHSASKTYECKICRKRFKYLPDLRFHEAK